MDNELPFQSFENGNVKALRLVLEAFLEEKKYIEQDFMCQENFSKKVGKIFALTRMIDQVRDIAGLIAGGYD